MQEAILYSPPVYQDRIFMMFFGKSNTKHSFCSEVNRQTKIGVTKALS